MTSALTIASHGRLASPSSLDIVGWGRLSSEAVLVAAPPVVIGRFGRGLFGRRIEKPIEKPIEFPWEEVKVETRAILMDDDEVLIQ